MQKKLFNRLPDYRRERSAVLCVCATAFAALHTVDTAKRREHLSRLISIKTLSFFSDRIKLTVFKLNAFKIANASASTF